MNWILFLSTCFHIMIFSSAWASVFWIKDRVAKTVAFFVVGSIYILLFQWYTPNRGTVLMDNDIVGQAIIEAWEFNLFGFYTIYFALSALVSIAYLGYFGIRYFKKKAISIKTNTKNTI